MKMNNKEKIERLFEILDDELKFTLPGSNHLIGHTTAQRKLPIFSYDDFVSSIQTYKQPELIYQNDGELCKVSSRQRLSLTKEIILDFLVIDPADGCPKRPSLILKIDDYSRQITGVDHSFNAKQRVQGNLDEQSDIN